VEQALEDILVPPNSSVKREVLLERNFAMYSEISKETEDEEFVLLLEDDEKRGFLLRPYK
jgi:hypothetical protein